MSDRVLVIVPTYNEVENLERILDRLHASVPTAHALVVDDGSPDGTGELADEAGRRSTRACTCCTGRPRPGSGPAYIAGFRWARERGYDVVVEMDADGSHAPEQLPGAAGGPRRRPTSSSARGTCPGERSPTGRCTGCCSRALGNRYTRWALRLPLSDATGGYRAARGELIDALPFDDVASQGYCFQVDWAWRAVRAGARVAEVPITFTERAFGRSKMSGSIVREALVRVTVWGLQDRLADWLPGRVARPVPARHPRRRAVSAAR